MYSRSQDSIVISARAKINLFLQVEGRRADGYHNLRTVMQHLALSDTLIAQKTGCGVSMVCDGTALPTDERNLVIRAAKRFLDVYRVCGGVAFELKKRIPVAAGLGGGSADAAAAIAALDFLYGRKMSQSAKVALGSEIGADVPCCFFDCPVLAEGIGDRITPLARMPRAYVCLAKPPESVYTKDVFARWDERGASEPLDIQPLLSAVKDGDLRRMASGFGNALTAVTASMVPRVYDLISAMREYGALGASMTGSGPTVFGFFEAEDGARLCMDGILSRCPGTVCMVTYTSSSWINVSRMERKTAHEA